MFSKIFKSQQSSTEASRRWQKLVRWVSSVGLFLLTTCPGQCCYVWQCDNPLMMSSPSSLSPGPAPAWSCVTMCWLVTRDAMDCHNKASVINNPSQGEYVECCHDVMSMLCSTRPSLLTIFTWLRGKLSSMEFCV